MSPPISRQDRFISDVIHANGAIDTNALSEPLKAALSEAGLGAKKLTALGGKDGRIDSPNDALRLYHSVEKFVSVPKREALQNELVSEFRRHSVRELTLKDALVLSAPEQRLFTTPMLKVPGVNQFSLAADREQGNKMCMPGAMAQIERFFRSQYQKPPQMADKHHRIQVATHETTSGRIEIDGREALRARAYIDDCLDRGRPVLVGVSALNADKFRVNEGITEHFVTISGRGFDSSGRLFYAFRDPGDRGNLGKFYIDNETGKLFKPGLTLADGARTVRDLQYEVSQVRTYVDRPAE